MGRVQKRDPDGTFLLQHTGKQLPAVTKMQINTISEARGPKIFSGSRDIARIQFKCKDPAFATCIHESLGEDDGRTAPVGTRFHDHFVARPIQMCQ